MKTNSALRVLLCVMFIVFLLSAFTACSDDNTEVQELEYEIEQLEHEVERLEREAKELEATIIRLEYTANADAAEHTHILRDCVDDCVELELPELWAEISGTNMFTLAYNPEHNISNTQIRVFENGNANIRLFPNGTFIANLFHNTKITGTYTEMTDGHETAVLFTYSGINNLSQGVGSFETTGLVTVVGGIVDDILTIPEDWDDGHGHGMDFAYKAYPLVFIGENNQRITLHADNTFEAAFVNDIRIIGFYGMRATSITFVPGSPTFDRYGMPAGTFLLAELRACGGDFIDNLAGIDDDCEFVECDDDSCDISTEQNAASDPAESPAPVVTPSPTENQVTAPTPSPAVHEPTSTPTPAAHEPTPTPSPADDDPAPTPTPSETDPTPTPTPADDPAPTEAPGDGDDENDNNGLEWCDECGEWH